MLPSPRHRQTFRRIIENALHEGECNVIAFCEVGKHDEGLEYQNMVPSDIVRDVLPNDRCIAASLRAYMCVWDQGGSGETGGIAVRLRTEPTCVQLRPDLAVDPRLVIFDFHVTAEKHPGMMGRLVHGMLHIRNTRKHQLRAPTRQAVTRLALQALEDRANSGALQPAVCILTGDVNLSATHADALVQPEFGEPHLQEHWHTETSNAALSGDVAFIRGTPSEAFEIEIGRSYPNRSIRRDMHDCFGFELRIPLVHMV